MKEANEYVSRDPTLYEYAFLYHVMLIQYAIFLLNLVRIVIQDVLNSSKNTTFEIAWLKSK